MRGVVDKHHIGQIEPEDSKVFDAHAVDRLVTRVSVVASVEEIAVRVKVIENWVCVPRVRSGEHHDLVPGLQRSDGLTGVRPDVHFQNRVFLLATVVWHLEHDVSSFVRTTEAVSRGLFRREAVNQRFVHIKDRHFLSA